jgi:hypothetical protein
MGAEMVLFSMGFKAKQRFMFDEVWTKAAFDEARKAIESIDEEKMQKDALLPEDYDSADEYKQILLKDLKDVERAVFEYDRQAGIVEGGDGIILLVSGGMSWGDSPTELYASMSRLAEADVFPDARWPEEGPSQNQATNK